MESDNINTPEYWDKYWEKMRKGITASVDVPSPFNNFINWAISEVIVMADILEVGAGSGRTAAYLAGKGYHVKATDFSPESIRIMKKDFGHMHRLDIQEETLNTATGQKRAWDVVIAMEVLEHYKNPSDPLMRIWNTLRPGGILIFSVPDKLGWMAESEYHYTHFDYELMTRLLMIHFREVKYYRGEMYGTGIWGIAIK